MQVLRGRSIHSGICWTCTFGKMVTLEGHKLWTFLIQISRLCIFHQRSHKSIPCTPEFSGGAFPPVLFCRNHQRAARCFGRSRSKSSVNPALGEKTTRQVSHRGTRAPSRSRSSPQWGPRERLAGICAPGPCAPGSPLPGPDAPSPATPAPAARGSTRARPGSRKAELAPGF